MEWIQPLIGKITLLYDWLLYTHDILSYHSRKTTGGTNDMNDGSVPPITVAKQCTSNWSCYWLHLC